MTGAAVIKSPFNRSVLKSTNVEKILAELERVIDLVSKDEWEELYIEVAIRVRELQRGEK
jgi:hypothetical protein